MVKHFLKIWIAKIVSLVRLLEYVKKRSRGVTILTYHRITTDRNVLGLSVNPETFTQQLIYLQSNYKIISLSEALDILDSKNINQNYCVITFDDGYLDNFKNAYPILERLGIPATIFINYDSVDSGNFVWEKFDNSLLFSSEENLDLQIYGLGEISLKTEESREKAVVCLHKALKKLDDSTRREIFKQVIESCNSSKKLTRSMMNWAEIKDISRAELVTIGAHTITHPILSRVCSDQAWTEIFQGKILIEEKVGLRVDLFSYPNGQPEDIGFDNVERVRNAGYRGACTTIPGVNLPGANPFYLKRIDVTDNMCTDCFGNFSPELFGAILTGVFSWAWGPFSSRPERSTHFIGR